MRYVLTSSVVVWALVGLGTRAEAGPIFGDAFVDPGLSGATVAFVAGGSYGPTGIARVTGGVGPSFAVIDVAWSGGASATGSSVSPGVPDLVLYFGTVSAAAGALTLTSIALSEDGTTFVTQTFSQGLTSAASGSSIGLSFSPAVVPVAARDAIVRARLTFVVGPGASFDLDGAGVNASPEPATVALVTLGLAGLGAVRRRRRRKTA